MTTHMKFPKISGFSSAVYNINAKFGIDQLPELTYFPKIKIHGTNAGVRINPRGTGRGLDSDVIAQDRREDVTSGHYGFVEWLSVRKKTFLGIANRVRDDADEDSTVIVYGEWGGPGVQAEGAVSKIPHNVFFIFGIRVVTETEDYFIHNPQVLDSYLLSRPADIKIIPHMTPIIINFDDPQSVSAAAEAMNAAVDQINIADPYIQSEFNITGAGEGLVFYPGSAFMCDTEALELFGFKVTGNIHASGTNGAKEK